MTYYNEGNVSVACASWAPVVGFLGCAMAVVFANLGGAYGTAKAGQGMMAMGVRSPDLLMKNIIPVVMAGVLGIYGLIVSVILNGKFTRPNSDGFATYSQYSAFAHLAAGLCCGLCSLASGLAIGIAADAGTRAVGAQSAMAASWKKMDSPVMPAERKLQTEMLCLSALS
ncbi:V-type proton ATPase [Fragilaria crotonensis]|nr:V-type proton ATPase [Fragilaria crotonensis]